MADPENEKEVSEEEKDEKEDEESDKPQANLTDLIDRNKFLIEGLKQQLERAKKRMMEAPVEEE